MKTITDRVEATRQLITDRESRRTELKEALESGKTISEELGSGTIVTWELGNNSFIEPYKSDATHLAKHIELRESGFGFTTTINQ